MLCGFACDDAFSKAYVIQASTLVPVVVALAAYVTFLVKRSKKDLKEIIELEYSEKEQE